MKQQQIIIEIPKTKCIYEFINELLGIDISPVDDSDEAYFHFQNFINQKTPFIFVKEGKVFLESDGSGIKFRIQTDAKTLQSIECKAVLNGYKILQYPEIWNTEDLGPKRAPIHSRV